MAAFSNQEGKENPNKSSWASKRSKQKRGQPFKEMKERNYRGIRSGGGRKYDISADYGSETQRIRRCQKENDGGRYKKPQNSTKIL